MKNQKATGAIDAQTFWEVDESSELTEAVVIMMKLGSSWWIKKMAKLKSYGKSPNVELYAFIYASKEDYANAIKAYKGSDCNWGKLLISWFFRQSTP